MSKKQLFNRLNARKAAAALATAMMLSALGLAGCASQAASGATLSESVDSGTVTARVESVDGDTLTVSLMEDPPDGGGQAGQPSSGQSSDDGANASADASGGTQPAQESDSEETETDGAASSSNGAATDGAAGEGSGPADGNGPGNGGEPPAKPDGDGGEPPAKPDGDAPSDGGAVSPGSETGESDDGDSASGGQGASGSVQGAPDGNAPGGTIPGGTEASLTVSDEGVIYTSQDGEEVQGSLADIEEGDMLTLTVGDDGTSVSKIEVGSAMGGPGGAQGAPDSASGQANSGSGATTFSEDAEEEGGTYDSSDSDVSAVMANNGATVTLKDGTFTKTGDSSNSGDSDFYGLGAGVVATDGANLTLDGGTLTTDAKGGNGVFAYGEGTSVTVSDMSISTSQGNSGGIEVAGGASLAASNLTVETQGDSSAAIRSDRGGGTETVTGGTYATHGTGSPAIYCTADVTVSDATLTSENSEGIVIEGLNSVALENVDVTGNVNGNAIRTGVVPNVMIYQSMSGDAEEGTGSFSMEGGSFTAENGTLFYVTNTQATIDLTDVDLNNAGDLLIVSGNDGQWGQDGSNGGTVEFTATDQALSGNITVDDISSLTLKLAGGSSYEGAVNSDGQAGTVNIELGDNATWKLTGDSYVSSLSGDKSGIDLNGHTLYVDGQVWSK